MDGHYLQIGRMDADGKIIGYWKTIRQAACCGVLVAFFIGCSTTGAVKNDPADGFNPFDAMVRFYRGPLNHLSAVRTGECPMFPSDSQYSLQSFRKHGMITGWIMTLDRLMRCGRDETRLSPRIRVNGKWKSYDPVEQNDFWWHGSSNKKDTD